MFKITNNFNDYHLNDPNKGRRDFFDKVMNALQYTQTKALNEDKIAFSAFIAGKKLQGVGGYFTNGKLIPRIVIPADYASLNENTNLITFKDNDAFCIFIHESSHYLHLISDNGKFIAKPFINNPPSDINNHNTYTDNNIVRINEYEAGWRSIIYNNIYNMNLKEKIIKINITNLAHYLDEPQCLTDIKNNIHNLTKNISTNPNTIHTINNIINSTINDCNEIINIANKKWINSLTKYSTLYDFKNHLSLSPSDSNKINNIIQNMNKKINNIIND